MIERQPPSPASTAAISERLRRTREARNLVPAAFARLVGVDQRSWHSFEHGRRRIPLDQAVRVCDATGVSLDWIYRGIDSHLPADLATALRRPMP